MWCSEFGKSFFCLPPPGGGGGVLLFCWCARGVRFCAESDVGVMQLGGEGGDGEIPAAGDLGNGAWLHIPRGRRRRL